MSTLRVSSINNAAASAGGIAIDSSGGVSGALPAPNRNLLYNGAMQVSQRGTSTTGITSGNYHTADRMQFGLSGLGTWTQDIQNDAPTGSGFRRSWRVLCTTAKASPAAGDFAMLIQALEGQDVQRVRKGTSSAQRLTVSFWVKSNVTGTYVAALFDDDNARINSQTYTISASATWEKKTITFPADTTGALDNDNAASLTLQLWLGGGSNFTSGTLATSWQANTNANRAVGQTNLAAATNNYWQVTGVQLEVGDVATDFEFKSYGQELRECQRYYEKSYQQSVAPATVSTDGSVGFRGSGVADRDYVPVFYKVVKRAIPATVTIYSTSTGATGKYRAIVAASDLNGIINMSGDSSFTMQSQSTAPSNDQCQFHWTASAEL